MPRVSRSTKRRARRGHAAAVAEQAIIPEPRPEPGGNALRGLARLVHPFPSLLVTAVTLALIPLADSGAPASLYIKLGLGMLLYQFAIGAANDVVDRDDDAAAKPWKPLVRGDLTARQATLLATAFAGAGLAATVTLELVPWLIGAACLACGLLYDLELKRTPLSWLPLAVAFPLIPLWVFTAADAWDHLLWWTLPIGILLGAAVHLANQLPDIEADRATGTQGTSQRIGARRSFQGALLLFGLGMLLAVAVLLFGHPERAGLVAAAAVLGFLLAPRATRFFGRDGFFGVLAASSAAAAVAFVSAA